MAKAQNELAHIALCDIQVDTEGNPRQQFDKDAQAALTKSIRKGGLMNPLTVREDDGKFVLIAGERRYRSLCEIHAKNMETTIACTVVPCDAKEAAFLQMDENLAREQLSMYETARGCARIRDEFEIGPSEISRRLSGVQEKGGKKISVQHVSNMLRCWDQLCPEVKEEWRKGHPRATFKTLIAVKAINDPEEQWTEWLVLSGQAERPETEEGEGGEGEGGGEGEPDPERSEPVRRRPSVKKLEDALEAIALSNHSDDWKEGAKKALYYAMGKAGRIPGVKLGK